MPAMRELRTHPTARGRSRAMAAAGGAMLPVGAAAYVLYKVYGLWAGAIPVVLWGIAAAVLVGRSVRAYRRCPACDGPTQFAGLGLSEFQLYDCPACLIRWDTKVRPQTPDD